MKRVKLEKTPSYKTKRELRKKGWIKILSLFIKINNTKEDYRVNLRGRKDFISIHKSVFFPISRALLCHQSLNRIFHHVYFRLLCLFCIRFDLIKNPLINEFSATVPKKKRLHVITQRGASYIAFIRVQLLFPRFCWKFVALTSNMFMFIIIFIWKSWVNNNLNTR